MTEPDILILDEATSALDSESEQIVQEVLQKFADCRNLFVIAHKYSSLLKADRIIVLDKGSVAESGTHEELLLTSGFYAKLCRKYAQERNSE